MPGARKGKGNVIGVMDHALVLRVSPGGDSPTPRGCLILSTSCRETTATDQWCLSTFHWTGRGESTGLNQLQVRADRQLVSWDRLPSRGLGFSCSGNTAAISLLLSYAPSASYSLLCKGGTGQRLFLLPPSVKPRPALPWAGLQRPSCSAPEHVGSFVRLASFCIGLSSLPEM